jgi:DNA-binding IclR family transcriptional regulator
MVTRFSRDEYMNGISGVAAPILDKCGLAVGAISVIALTHQMTESTRMHTKTLLLNSTRSIAVGAFN